MSKCPLCHAPVKDDFGLIECSACGAQLILHMDGRVEYQGVKENSRAHDEPPTQMRTIVRPSGATNPDAADLVAPGKTGAGYRMPEDDLFDATREDTQDIIQSREEEIEEEKEEENRKEFLGADSRAVIVAAEDENAGEQVDADQEIAAEEFQDDDVLEEAPLAQEAASDFDGMEDQGPAPLAYNAPQVSSSPDLGDVAKFGNSEVSGGREGPLRYNLFIEGIDTVDVREAFREALTDRKFMWDTDQILRSVRNGRVNIPNVAPTKAYILITRLRGMSVQVRWEQYAISQS